MKRSRGGSVLILALWAVAALSVAAVAEGTRVSLQLKWAGRLNEARQSWHLAWAAAEIAGQELASDVEPAWDAPKEPWGRPPTDPMAFAPGWIRTRIQDEQSRIPLNRAPVELIVRLPGFTLQTAEELIARRSAGKPVAHLGELLSLTGFQKEQLQKLADLVTVVGAGAVNLNTAPAAVLNRLGLSPSLSERIAAFQSGPDGRWGTQDDGIFPDVEQILPVLEERCGPLFLEDQTTLGNLISSQFLGVRSSFFQVEAEGWVQEKGIHTRVLAVMERTGSSGHPIVRGWHEI